MDPKLKALLTAAAKRRGLGLGPFLKWAGQHIAHPTAETRRRLAIKSDERQLEIPVDVPQLELFPELPLQPRDAAPQEESES